MAGPGATQGSRQHEGRQQAFESLAEQCHLLIQAWGIGAAGGLASNSCRNRLFSWCFWLSSIPPMPLLLLPAQGYLSGDVLLPEAQHLPNRTLLPLLQPRADSDSLKPYSLNKLAFIEYLLCAMPAVESWGLYSHYSLLLQKSQHCSGTISSINHDHHPYSKCLQHLLLCPSLALNSPCVLSCILALCQLLVFLFESLCFASVKAKTKDPTFPQSNPYHSFREHVWNAGVTPGEDGKALPRLGENCAWGL